MQRIQDGMSFPGRGRGNFPSYRGGRGGRGFPPIQHGNTRLVNSDISGLSLLKELENNPNSLKRVQEFLRNSSEGESSYSFAKIVAEQDDESYERKSCYDQDILILENRDLQWKDEPWSLIQRYLGTASYAAGSYKQRNTYESMLLANSSCEIRHFRPNTQAKAYSFSKIIIKQIISVEEWGLNPFSEKEYTIPNQNALAKYNFWDYKEAFYKTFLYQNPLHKHTWFIKVCPLVYKRKLPNWFYNWWIIYGGNESILPQPFLELFHKWKKVSPAIIEAEYDKTYCHNMTVLHFFCEFGIPWIWRWEPEVGFNQDNIPCLKRISFIKFWKKMIRNNADGLMEGQETVDQINERIAEYEKRISDKQQREAFNPFDIIEERISTQNLSKKERFERYMKEAEQAILKKLDTDKELSKESHGSTSMSQESQDPYGIENDLEMAEFMTKMCPRSNAAKTPSLSSSSDSAGMKIDDKSSNKEDFEERRGSKKKKGKNRKR